MPEVFFSKKNILTFASLLKRNVSLLFEVQNLRLIQLRLGLKEELTCGILAD